MKLKYIFGLLFCVSLFSCKKEIEKVPQENTKVKIPAFSSQSAYDLVKAQVDMGPRAPGTPGAKTAIKWMRSKLKSYGWQTIDQTFEATVFKDIKVKGTNIIGRYKPEVKERVLLCAHWDSRLIAEKDSTRQDEPILGANDGGSGVGVLLEIARVISENPIPMGVDIVFFDVEDQGENNDPTGRSWGLGSQHWAKNLHEKPYEVKYGILLDMVGAPDAEFPKEGYSMQRAAPIVNKVWGLAKKLNKQNYFVDRPLGGNITDDHYFIMEYARIPVIDIIHHKNKGFMKEHHTHDDDMDAIDKKTLGAVGQVVLSTIYKESNRDF